MMYDSPLSEDDDRRTAIHGERDERPPAADPHDEPGARGTAARLPYWIIVLAMIAVALIALYLAWRVLPPR